LFIMEINKIHILGPPGSGKTHLAKELSNKLKLDYFELDNISWEIKYKKKRDIFEKQILLEKIILNNKWIVEGVQTSFIHSSINKADKIIFLNFNFFILFYRIFRRYLFNIKKENFFRTINLVWIAFNYKIKKGKFQIYKNILNTYDNIVYIKTKKDLKLFLSRLN